MIADPRDVVAVRTLVEVSEEFEGLRSELRGSPGASEVTSQCTMRVEDKLGGHSYRVGQGNGFALEWSAGAEFVDIARAISFTVRLGWHDGAWSVEGAVHWWDRHRDEVDYLFELPDRFAPTLAEVEFDLISHARALSERSRAVIQRFLLGTP